MRRIKIVIIGIMIFLSPVVKAQSTDLCKIATKKYSSSQIEQFSHNKIAAINFYYTESFIVKNLDVLKGEKKHAFLNNFDISKYEERRDSLKRVSFILQNYDIEVTMLSLRELETILSELENQ